MTRIDKRRNWSAIILDGGVLDTFNAPEMLYALTDQQRTALLGITDYLRWHRRWEHLTWTRDELDAFVDDTELRLMTPTLLGFRQSPTDNCILQYTTDGGTTWIDAFDFHACLPAGLGDVVNTNNVTQTTNLTTTYNNYGLGAALPGVIYDGTIGDLFRDDLLCVMTQILVQALVATELDRRARQANDWRAVGGFLETVGFALAGVTGGWSILGTQIAQGILENAADAWVELSEAILNNEPAQLAVACCWYKGLRGQTVTASRWSFSLDSCGFTPLSFEEQIRGAIAPLLDTNTNEGLGSYLEFLRLLQDALPLAERGLFDNCGCDNVCDDFDFTLTNGSWEHIPGSLANEQWVQNLYWEAVPVDNIVGQDYNQLTIRRTFPVQAVERVEITFDFLDVLPTDYAFTVQSWSVLNGGTTVAAVVTNYATRIVGTNMVVTIDVGGQDITEIRIGMTAWIGPGIPVDPGYARAKRVTVVCVNV